MSDMINNDTTAILKGMGVIFTSSTEMRIAENSDNILVALTGRVKSIVGKEVEVSSLSTASFS